MALAMALIMCCQGLAAAHAVLDKGEVKAKLRQAWESIHTLEFQCDVVVLDAKGEPKTEQGISRFEYLIDANGSRSVVLKAIRPGGEEIFDNLYEDGRKLYHVTWDPATPGRASEIVVRNQVDAHDDYRNIMCPALMFLTPYGRPLHLHLDDPGASVEAPDGSTPWVVFPERKMTIRCKLDPRHDWIARELVIDGYCTMTVDRFALADGRWFPVEGHTEYLHKPFNKERFKISGLHFNRDIPPSSFNPMRFAKDGTRLVDAVTREARLIGKPRKQSGPRREDRAPTSASGVPVAASVEPSTIPWGTVLASASIGSLICALVIRFRGKRT